MKINKHNTNHSWYQTAWICNTDVESEWISNTPEHKEKLSEHRIIFNGFEEIMISGIGSANTAILRDQPDSYFMSYVEALGVEIPEILVVGDNRKHIEKSTTQLIYEDNRLINRLQVLSQLGRLKYMESFGVSELIEQIAKRANLKISYTGANKAAWISRKSTNRRISEKLCLPKPEGRICETSREIPEAVRTVRSEGWNGAVVVKPDIEASGRGQFIVHSEKDFEKLVFMLDRGNLGKYRIYVVERWYPEAITFSYDFQIKQGGSIRSRPILRRVLETSRGKPYGYIYPFDFGHDIYNAVCDAVQRIANFLYGEFGYLGQVRCDGLLLKKHGLLFPLLELNARHSFFSFLDPLHMLLAPGRTGLFCWYFFRNPGHIEFREFLIRVIGTDLLYNEKTKEGVVIPVWKTVIATQDVPELEEPFPLRRLFVLIFANTPYQATTMSEIVRNRIDNFYNSQ